MVLDPKCNEFFEVFRFGITAAYLPCSDRSSGDAKSLRQPSLCQSDGGTQGPYDLPKGIVWLARGESLHQCAPFCVCQRSVYNGSARNVISSLLDRSSLNNSHAPRLCWMSSLRVRFDEGERAKN